jgi:hypothetical protein
VTPFELEMSIPADLQFAETVRLVSAQAARQAGANEADAVSFGGDVERALRECPPGAGGRVAVVVYGRAAEVEVVLTGARTIRVARALPLDV